MAEQIEWPMQQIAPTLEQIASTREFRAASAVQMARRAESGAPTTEQKAGGVELVAPAL